jgi:hypothetical protein
MPTSRASNSSRWTPRSSSRGQDDTTPQRSAEIDFALFGLQRSLGGTMMLVKHRGIAASLIAILLLTAACSKPGSAFVGKWVNTKYGDGFEIVRNGDQFLFINSTTNTKRGAVYKDGGLQIGNDLRITYVQATDTILLSSDMFGQAEYKRAQ